MSATRPPAFDDRFGTPIEASRRGAHRARPRPASAGLPVLAGIAVVLLVLGGGYVVLKGNGVSDSGSNLAAASAVDNEPVPSGAGKTTAPPTGTAETPDQPTATATKDAGPDVKVNRGIALKVLNSITVAGLAKRVQADIEPNGWKVGSTGNSINRNLAVTKIYYGRSADKATAQALQKDLGFGTVVRDSSVATTGLVVVLGRDAQ